MIKADYVLQVVKGVKKVFDDAMSNMFEQFQDNRIINFYQTNETDEIFNSTEGLTGITELGDEETPPSLALEEGYQITLSPDRFGGGIVINERTRLLDKNDSTIVVDKYLDKQKNKLLTACKNKLLTSAFYMLNNAFNSSALTLAPDDVELCGTHTWATGGTFNNKATAALDADAIDDMEEYAGDFYDPTDTDQPFSHDFNVIVVKKGSDAARMAKRLFAFNIKPISVVDINIYEGEKTVIETPYLATASKNYWFAFDDNFDNPIVLGINKTPSLNEPIKADNEAIRTNVTSFWKRGIADMPHAFYGADGST